MPESLSQIIYLRVSKISVDIFWGKENISCFWQHQEKGIQSLKEKSGCLFP